MGGRPKDKAIGSHGSWFAKIRDESLPCLHRHWVHGLDYCDPHCVVGDPKWDEYVAALKSTKKAILTTDHVEDGPFRRTGYVAVFAIDDVSVEGSNLRLRLVDRLADLE
jgi:hypothetical protein